MSKILWTCVLIYRFITPSRNRITEKSLTERNGACKNLFGYYLTRCGVSLVKLILSFLRYKSIPKLLVRSVSKRWVILLYFLLLFNEENILIIEQYICFSDLRCTIIFFFIYLIWFIFVTSISYFLYHFLIIKNKIFKKFIEIEEY